MEVKDGFAQRLDAFFQAEGFDKEFSRRLMLAVAREAATIAHELIGELREELNK